MKKNILLESTKSNFKVLEHKPANVLKRIQGVLSDFKTNRNGRIYPRELWENVLNSDYVKEMIESHGLVGELDHPEERLEISLQNVSHVINDMWIEGDKVMGIIDILPTPSGKIVSELLDYGTDIGISSRGAGSVGANNIVDPDYQFVTFDFVARPSCEAARLNMIVESVQPEIDNNSDDKVNNILEKYKIGLKEDNTTSSYIDIREVVRYAEEYLTSLLNSSVGITKQQDGQYMITMKNDDKTIDKWLKLHDQNNLKENYTDTDEQDYARMTPEEIDDYNSDYFYNKAQNEQDEQKKFEYACLTAASQWMSSVTEDTSRDFIKGMILPVARNAFNSKNYTDEDYMKEIIFNLENGRGFRFFNFNKMNESVYIIKQYAGPFGVYNVCEWEADSPEKAVEEFLEINPSYKDGKYGTIKAELKNGEAKLNEAAMSDQEVFKVVLGWYKQQIESGKMTLNQCYQLLSDKAKVSLNKMVDQSKIKESIVNKTINKLIKESIELNKNK